jgi:putative spermidine/putrescine transport system permease protein
MNGYTMVPAWSRALSLCLGWTVMIYLVMPNLVIVPVSLTSTSFFSIPAFGDYSLHHYAKLVAEPSWGEAAFDSLAVALTALALACIVGTLAAFGLWRMRSGIANAIRIVSLGPLIVPPVVLGLAYYEPWILLGWRDTVIGVAVAHAVLGVPYVVITVGASLAAIDPRIEQAARNLGASTWQTLRWVILPNVKAGIATGALFVAHLSWDEVIVTLFVTVRRVETLPKRIYEVVQDDLDPAVAAVATLLMLLTLLGALIVMAARRRPSPSR